MADHSTLPRASGARARVNGPRGSRNESWRVRLSGWDETILRGIAETAPSHPRLVKAVTALGSRPCTYAITGVCALTYARRTHTRPADAAIRHLSVVAAGDLARQLLCRAVGRPRPPASVRHGRYSGASFPSRHATLAALTAGIAIDTAAPAHRRLAACAGLTGCAAVGASRLRLGVHWPTDVAAGFLFAAAWHAASRGAKLLPGPQP